MGVSDKSQRQEVIEAISPRRLQLKVAFPSVSDGAKTILRRRCLLLFI